MATAPPPSPAEQVLRLLGLGAIPRCIQVVVELGVPDRIGDEPRPVEELARDVDAHPLSLYRVLRFLSVHGLFVERPGRAFAHSDMSRTLASGPRSLRPMLRWHQAMGKAREALDYSVRTGRSAFEKVYGKTKFEWMADDPEMAALFDAANAQNARLIHSAILDVVDLSSFQRVVDVGGGTGTFLRLLLERHPQARGVLFELPHVAARATAELSGTSVATRVEVISGDAFERVPEGGDLYALVMTLHDFDDDHASRLLTNVRAAMRPEARVLIGENVLPATGPPTLGHFYDLLTLVVSPSGRERNEAELRALLESAGLALERVVDTARSTQALIARPA
jgi:SAM-dependent methyltransferase